MFMQIFGTAEVKQRVRHDHPDSDSKRLEHAIMIHPKTLWGLQSSYLYSAEYFVMQLQPILFNILEPWWNLNSQGHGQYHIGIILLHFQIKFITLPSLSSSLPPPHLWRVEKVLFPEDLFHQSFQKSIYVEAVTTCSQWKHFRGGYKFNLEIMDLIRRRQLVPS